MGLLARVKSMFGGGRLDVSARFELMREAIHGTMSKFYMARDRETGHIVGLKILDLEKTAALEGRFRHLNKPTEGQIAVSLLHPRIVHTYEHGLTTRGEQYLIMEHLSGEGLNTLIATGNRLLDGRRLALVRQAAEATAAVHAAGYIHRDICPRNFVVSPEVDSLKLIDFGLTVPATAPFMQPGNRTGTPKYMAPEVVRRRETDHRLDIFSFGVTAFELFAGQTPWPTTTMTGKAAMAHTQPPTPLSDVCPNIDRRLSDAIHRCLAPQPADRPETLERFLELVAPIQQETAP